MLNRPQKGQSKRTYIAWFTSDAGIRSDYPNEGQRAEMAAKSWTAKKARASYVAVSPNDEVIYLTARFHLPQHLVDKVKGFPESGHGYHNVWAKMKSGKTKMATIHNCDEIEMEDEDDIDEVEDLEMSDIA